MKDTITLEQTLQGLSILREQVITHPALALAAFMLGVAIWFLFLYGTYRLVRWCFRKPVVVPPAATSEEQLNRLVQAENVLQTFELLAKHGYVVVKASKL